MDDGAHLLERLPELAQPLLAALRALGEDGFDFDPAFERRRQRVEHAVVVAAEQRQHQPLARAVDDVQHRLRAAPRAR